MFTHRPSVEQQGIEEAGSVPYEEAVKRGGGGEEERERGASKRGSIRERDCRSKRERTGLCTKYLEQV